MGGGRESFNSIHSTRFVFIFICVVVSFVTTQPHDHRSDDDVLINERGENSPLTVQAWDRDWRSIHSIYKWTSSGVFQFIGNVESQEEHLIDQMINI